MNVYMEHMDVLVAVVGFVVHGVNKEPNHGGINRAIGVTNSVGHLPGTVISHDANNIGQDASAF